LKTFEAVKISKQLKVIYFYKIFACILIIPYMIISLLQISKNLIWQNWNI